MENYFSGDKKGKIAAEKYYKKIEALVNEEYEKKKREHIDGWPKEKIDRYNAEIKREIERKYEDIDLI